MEVTANGTPMPGTHSYMLPDTTTLPGGAIFTTDGGYLYTGSTYNNGSIDAWLLKYDSSNVLQWGYTYPSANNNEYPKYPSEGSGCYFMGAYQVGGGNPPSLRTYRIGLAGASACPSTPFAVNDSGLSITTYADTVITVSGSGFYSTPYQLLNGATTSQLCIQSVINEPSPTTGFTISGNPAHNFLQVVSGNMAGKMTELKIVDVRGRLVWQQEPTVLQEIFQIDVSTFSKGMYLLTVKGEKGFLTKKFLKE